VERSRTEFTIRTLTPELKEKVLADNNYPNHGVDGFLGFHLAFETVSEKGEEVGQELNMLFVPRREGPRGLEGDYLRDRAYEEERPMVADFRFDPGSLQLVMTTTYTHVVSVDTITLLNPRLRLRADPQLPAPTSRPAAAGGTPGGVWGGTKADLGRLRGLRVDPGPRLALAPIPGPNSSQL
jgi:hypothetical protein